MNWINEQELPILRGARDRLIVDEASHATDATFYLVVPTDGANCCLPDLRVHGLSGHEPCSKNLQNKLSTDGGVPARSPMLKLDKEMESVKKCQSSSRIFFTHIFLSVTSHFYEEGSSSTFYGKIHLLWEVGDWFPKWKGGRRVSCASTVFSFG